MPAISITARATLDETGAVRLEWDHTPAIIGLAAEVHRGPAGFTPSPENHIGRTTQAIFVDRNPPAGSSEYAVICTDDCGAGCAPAPAEPRRSPPARVSN